MVIGSMNMSPIGAYNQLANNSFQHNLGAVPGVTGVNPLSGSEKVVGVSGDVETDKTSGGPGKVQKGECQTCKNRKYQDGSNENVSFKSAAHVSPQAAGAAVRAHEGEHVSNAYSKAAKDNGKVIQASVSIHMSICPECGRSYVSGGVTNTKIAYNESNPFEKNLKAFQAEAMKGNKINMRA